MIKNFKLIIEYDGTRYHGWQRQKEDATIQGEIEKAFGHASRALDLLPEGPIFWRVISLITIGFCQRLSRNYSEAIEKISKALELASEAGFVFLYFISTSLLSKLQLERGSLFAAIDTCKKAFR